MAMLKTCARGVVDCAAPGTLLGETCADYATEYATPAGKGVMLGSGAAIAIVMAFCIGGNDSANSWASSVGSGAIRLRYALLLGGAAEWLGATLLGQGVSNTIQKGVSQTDDPDCWACGFCDSRMAVYAVGMLAALLGAAVFLLAATFGKMPVSTTHAIVGGVVGMTMVGASPSCLQWTWKGLSGIVASWVISPILSGVIAGAVYGLTNKLCVRPMPARTPARPRARRRSGSPATQQRAVAIVSALRAAVRHARRSSGSTARGDPERGASRPASLSLSLPVDLS
jgi:sodium-dependent phosphate transporter